MAGGFVHTTAIEIDGHQTDAVAIEKQVVTIKSAGTYVITGTLADGQIVVDTDEADIVRLILSLRTDRFEKRCVRLRQHL